MKQKLFFLLLLTSILVLLPCRTTADALTITEVGGFGTGKIKAVAVQGNYAYCAVDYLGLEIYDISTPGNPVVVGRYSGCLNPHDVAVSGNYVALGATNDIYTNLYILDVSDPTNPISVKSYHTYYFFGSPFFNIHTYGNYAYGTLDGEADWVVDITNPPTYLDDFAEFSDMDKSGQYIYLVKDDGFKVLDVTDPLNYTTVSDTTFPGYDEYLTIALQGNYAYIGASGNQLLVVDISQPTAPVLV
ncbi:MAG: hypothetical protein GY757_49410, partial [bacterium]|nr:hypothetical protein [bacterium]